MSQWLLDPMQPLLSQMMVLFGDGEMLLTVFCVTACPLVSSPLPRSLLPSQVPLMSALDFLTLLSSLTLLIVLEPLIVLERREELVMKSLVSALVSLDATALIVQASATATPLPATMERWVMELATV